MSRTCATSDLLTKYQPRRLAEKFDGLESVANSFIARAIATRSLPRLLLLTGPGGCGKGTTARIIALRHCCENKGHHLYDPCLQCRGCEPLRAGLFSTRYSEFGYSEFDAVRMDGEKIVSHIERESRCRSLEGDNRRLFCIDELQRNRTSIQERLLRFTENIGNRIIICTINPNDVLSALRDRFVHVALKPPTSQQAVAGLTRIAGAEGFELKREAAELIVRTKANNPRRCVNTLSVSMTMASAKTIGSDAALTALEMEGEDLRCV